MRNAIKTILFTLTVLLLFASMLQKAFNWPKFEPLRGVVIEKPKPELSFQSYRDGSFQQQTEQHLEQHFGCREPLIRLYNQYLWDFYNKTHVSEDQVAFGKKGWMYEPWTVPDYYQQLFHYYASDSLQMASMLAEEAQRVLRLQQELQSHDIQLFVCMMPAKDLFYPEYLPDNQDTAFSNEPTFSARFFNEEIYTRLGINHLNLEQWFMQIKDSVNYMVFPKTGMHWSRYAAIQAADTLIRYMENLGDINMHNLVFGPAEIHSAIGTDDDLERLLNLLRPMSKPQYTYANVTTDGDTTAIKPKIIVIGDSFWWTIAVQIPLQEVFSESPYWYYNSIVHYDSRYHSVNEFDLAEELLTADFVVLSYSATQLYRMNNGFTQQALMALGCTTEGNAADSAAFVQLEIQRTIANIMTTPDWMKAIRKQATQNGKSIQQTVRDNAAWFVNNKIQQGTLIWPKKESGTNNKTENHGIQ
jgi:hypothetical protein